MNQRKSRIIMTIKNIGICTLIFLFNFACYQFRQIEEIKKQNLFMLSAGYKQDQVIMDGILVNNNYFQPDILYKDGFLYLSDVKNAKVLKISSTGDLVLVIYSPEKNPLIGSKNNDQNKNNPQNAIENTPDNGIKTIIKKTYDFQIIEKLAVDTNKNIYVTEYAKEYSLFDEKNNHYYLRYVLQFDRNGNFTRKIGRNGTDSEPFGFIWMMSCDENNNLIVITKNSTGFNLHRFDEKGNLNKHFIINKNFLNKLSPGLADKVYELIDIHILNSQNNFAVTIDIYGSTQENNEQIYTNGIFTKNIYIINIQTDNIFLVHQFKPKKVMNKEKTKEWYLPLPALLGISNENYFIFYQQDIFSGNFILEITNQFGRKIVDKKSIALNQQKEILSYFKIADDGSIYTYQVNEDTIDFFRWRWRTDLFTNKQ